MLNLGANRRGEIDGGRGLDGRYRCGRRHDCGRRQSPAPRRRRLALRCGGRHRFRSDRRFEAFELRDQPAHRRNRAPRVDGVAQVLQLIEPALHEIERGRRRLAAAFGNSRQQRLERVAQIAHRQQARHARTAFQRVQEALQHGDGRLILPLPNLLQRGLGVIENLRCFLGEDRGDLGIEPARRLDNRLGLRRRRGLDGRYRRRRLLAKHQWLEPRQRSRSELVAAASRDRVGHHLDLARRHA